MNTQAQTPPRDKNRIWHRIMQALVEGPVEFDRLARQLSMQGVGHFRAYSALADLESRGLAKIEPVPRLTAKGADWINANRPEWVKPWEDAA